MTQTKEHIYFIGIGGISMSGLAEILAAVIRYLAPM